MSTIVSIVLILASLGLFFGFIDPTYSRIREVREEKAAYDNALDNSKKLQEERDKLLKRFNEMDPNDVAALSKLLPDHIDNIRLVIDIDEMAKSYGMRIRNFKADTVEKKDAIGKDTSGHGTLNLSFSTSASYTTFLAFLRDLERSLRLIDVTSIGFAASEAASVYDYNVTVKTYWLK